MKNKSLKGKITCIYGGSAIDKMIEVINEARILRACINEDEGVTYP